MPRPRPERRAPGLWWAALLNGVAKATNTITLLDSPSAFARNWPARFASPIISAPFRPDTDFRPYRKLPAGAGPWGSVLRRDLFGTIHNEKLNRRLLRFQLEPRPVEIWERANP